MFFRNTISIATEELTVNIFTSQMCLSTVPNNPSTLIRQVCARSCPATNRFFSIWKENFVVRHYSGFVEYSVSDLLSKNTDKVSEKRQDDAKSFSSHFASNKVKKIEIL